MQSVNLYDVLRQIIRHIAMPETMINDCLKVIDEAEKWNALGTTARAMEVQAHQHRYPPMSDVCEYCGKARDI
jgi:hypothetical protein